MSFRYSTGYRFNALESALSVAASTADTDYPASALKDGRLSRFYKTAAIGQTDIDVDLSVLVNGNFDTSTLASWTDASTGGASTSEEGTIVRSGKALKLTTSGAASVASRYQDVLVRGGSPYSASAWLRGDGTRTARFRIYFPEYGYYVTSGGTLSASPSDLGSVSGTSYTQIGPINFSTPDITTVLLGAQTLVMRVILLNNTASGGSAYAEDVAVWPNWDTVSIHGHNLDPIASVNIASSTNNFSSTSAVGTMTVKPFSAYYVNVSDVTAQYVRIRITAGSVAATQLTEVVVCKSSVLLKSFKWPYKIQSVFDQKREQLGDGVKIYKSRILPRRVLSPDWETHTYAQFAEIRDLLMQRSEHGNYPILVIPDDSNPEVVIYGRVPNQYTPQRERLLNRFSLVFEEMPYPREEIA